MSDQYGTVYIVDDDDSVRRATARLLAVEGFKPLTFASAEEFLQFPLTDAPCCLVLDLQLPGLTGIELQEQLALLQSQLPIVFISGHADIPDSVRAIKAGATDFLCKPVQSEVLLCSVKQAISQYMAVAQQAASLQAARVMYASLTLRERQVSELVVQGKLNKQIAGDLGITEATVKVHRGRVMQKLQVTSLAELVRLFDRLHRCS